jgi:hypothetical protein
MGKHIFSGTLFVAFFKSAVKNYFLRHFYLNVAKNSIFCRILIKMPLKIFLVALFQNAAKITYF